MEQLTQAVLISGWIIYISEQEVQIQDKHNLRFENMYVLTAKSGMGGVHTTVYIHNGKMYVKDTSFPDDCEDSEPIPLPVVEYLLLNS